MSDVLKSYFKGTGSIKEFVKESNLLFSALNNIKFIMPAGYSGVYPSMEIKEGSLIFDFGDCLVFTTKNISWNLTGNAIFRSATAAVVNGVLQISVNATKT